MDGDLVYGTFWSMEDDYTVEPYIRVAAGDYLDLCDNGEGQCIDRQSCLQ